MKVYIKSSTNSRLVGIFWYVDGKVIGIPELLSSLDRSGRYVNTEKLHMDEWHDIAARLGLDTHLPYTYYPRGRVMFDSMMNQFIVVGNKAMLADKGIQKKIRDFFGLPKNTIFDLKFEDHDHYDNTNDIYIEENDDEGDFDESLYNSTEDRYLY